MPSCSRIPSIHIPNSSFPSQEECSKGIVIITYWSQIQEMSLSKLRARGPQAQNICVALVSSFRNEKADYEEESIDISLQWYQGKAFLSVNNRQDSSSKTLIWETTERKPGRSASCCCLLQSNKFEKSNPVFLLGSSALTLTGLEVFGEQVL